MTMYFIPASFAIRTQASASNFTGLNCAVSFEYSVTGIFARFMIHSPMPGMVCPFHCPAGIAYSPQWMNRPYFASRNQASRASRAGSAAACVCAAAERPAPISKRAATRVREFTMNSGLRVEGRGSRLGRQVVRIEGDHQIGRWHRAWIPHAVQLVRREKRNASRPKGVLLGAQERFDRAASHDDHF